MNRTFEGMNRIYIEPFLIGSAFKKKKKES